MGDAHKAIDRHRVERPPPAPALQLRLRSAPTAPAKARAAVSVFSDVLPAEMLADLRLIVTELITNSVKYGPGGPIALTITRDEESNISGEVADGGYGGVRMRRGYDPADGGLGLQIVDALTSDWGVHPDSSDVWFELGAS
jgi:two-component sensor histidine kinase